MRISTAHAYDTGIATLQRRQSELSQAQEQLTSGKRVARASDDPAAAARAERALAIQAQTEAAQRALDASRDATALTESALGDAGELLQQARELMVAAGNATYSDAERAGLAARLRSLRGELLAVANRGDGAGGYLFGGQGSSRPPFVDSPSGVVFDGVGGRLDAAGREALPLSADGGAIWLSAPTGNGVFETRVVASAGGAVIDGGQVTDPSALTGASYRISFAVDAAGATTYSVTRDGVATALTGQPYAPGQPIEIDGLSVTIDGAPAAGDTFEAVPSAPTLSVFDVLDRAAGQLETPGRSGSQIAQANLQDLDRLDTVAGRLMAARSDAGDALNRIDRLADTLDERKLNAQTARSDAEDLDLAAAISTFANQQTGYDAALKSYAMVQRLSLFQYLNV